MGIDAAIGTPLLRRVHTGNLNKVIFRLVDAWLAERATKSGSGSSFTFKRFCDAHTDDELKAIAGGDVVPKEDAVPTKVIVRIPGILANLADGADTAEVEPGTVGDVLKRLRTLHPKLVAHLLPSPGSVNESVNLYVKDEDIRALGGLSARLEAGDELTILPALAGG